MDQSFILREPYFLPISLNEVEGFCIDDRYSTNRPYLKFPGGITFFANQIAITKTINNQQTLSYQNETSKIAKQLLSKGYHIGIHSDDDSDDSLNINKKIKNDPIGCGYLSKRQDIMNLIGRTEISMTNQIKNILPEIYIKLTDKMLINKIVLANSQLAKNPTYFDATPRQVAQAAVKEKAPVMIVEGQHSNQAIAIINFKPNSTFNTALAAKNNLPAYNYDAWAFDELLIRIPALSKYDHQEMILSALIDTIATVNLFGVNNIYVRY